MIDTIIKFFTMILTKIFGSKKVRDIKALKPYVDEINSIYAGLSSLTDEQIRNHQDHRPRSEL